MLPDSSSFPSFFQHFSNFLQPITSPNTSFFSLLWDFIGIVEVGVLSENGNDEKGKGKGGGLYEYNKEISNEITDRFPIQFYIIIFKPKIYRFKFINLCITYYTFFNLLKKTIPPNAQTLQYLS